jgi:hypothetical protein
MDSAFFNIFTRFFLLTVFVVTVGGCGSNGSTASSPESNGTGSLAAKLIWNSSGAKTTAKTLYAAPNDVLQIQIIVSAADMQGTVSDFFSAAAGTGTLKGIPAGTGRTVTVNGLVSSGTIGYQGITTVNIVAGQTATASILMAPVTTASPRGGTYTTPQSVTLTASVPATIYYTTNGDDPTNSPNFGPGPITNILVEVNSVLKFFSIVVGGTAEAVKSESYHNP